MLKLRNTIKEKQIKQTKTEGIVLAPKWEAGLKVFFKYYIVTLHQVARFENFRKQQ